MKTAEERAREWVSVNSEKWASQQYAALVVLLKEERKIARHDCVESLLAIRPGEDGYLTYRGEDLIYLNSAINAVMNARAT